MSDYDERLEYYSYFLFVICFPSIFLNDKNQSKQKKSFSNGVDIFLENSEIENSRG